MGKKKQKKQDLEENGPIYEKHDVHDLLGQGTKTKNDGVSLDENPKVKSLKSRIKDLDDSL